MDHKDTDQKFLSRKGQDLQVHRIRIRLRHVLWNLCKRVERYNLINSTQLEDDAMFCCCLRANCQIQWNFHFVQVERREITTNWRNHGWDWEADWTCNQSHQRKSTWPAVLQLSCSYLRPLLQRERSQGSSSTAAQAHGIEVVKQESQWSHVTIRECVETSGETNWLLK